MQSNSRVKWQEDDHQVVVVFRIPGMVGKIGNVQARNLQDVGGRRDGCPERGNKRAVYDLAKQSDSNIYKAAKRR